VRRVLLCLLLILAPPGALAQTTVDQLIRDLQSPKWKVRQQATARLIKLGKQAVPALRQAIAQGNHETRWRARAALNQILPLEGYLQALQLASAGKLAEAVAKLKPTMRLLPKGTRPDPTWTLGILEEVRDLDPSGAASLGRGIAYHNLQCLLREAGIRGGPTLETARQIYRKLIPSSKRAARLLAVLDWEAGDKQAAQKHWKIGKPNATELKQIWTLYDVASYQGVQGKHKEAIATLAKAIERSESARREARISSDFDMLQKLPAFKALLAGKAEKKPKIKLIKPR